MWGPCCWGYVSWVVKDMCVVMGVNKVNSNPVQLTQSWVKFASLRGVWQQSKMSPSTTQEIVQVNIFWKGIQTIRPSPTVTSSLQPSQQIILPQISTVWSSQTWAHLVGQNFKRCTNTHFRSKWSSKIDLWIPLWSVMAQKYVEVWGNDDLWIWQNL